LYDMKTCTDKKMGYLGLEFFFGIYYGLSFIRAHRKWHVQIRISCLELGIPSLTYICRYYTRFILFLLLCDTCCGGYFFFAIVLP
jgi:hypothetical protein